MGKKNVTLKTWKEIRKDVINVNPHLADIIDQIDPSDKYKFVEATYLYGDIIINNGVLQLPENNDTLFPLKTFNAKNSIKDLLSYSDIPLFLTLEKDCEVFIDTGDRIVPLNLFHKGSLLGLFESMDFIFGRHSTAKWSVTAGSRSIIMLPKITDNLGLRRLRMHYGISSTTRLKSLSDHWNIFVTIAKHNKFEQPWHNKILFFSREWLTNKDNFPGWNKFRDYLLCQAWNQAQFSIGMIELSLNWEKFAAAISSRNLKPRPYLSDHVKHILSVAMGNFPSFITMDDSQQAAPKIGLQKSFTEVYMLRDYLPTIMHCCSLEDIRSKPVYYSLSFPSLVEGSPLSNTSSTIMLNTRDVKLLIDTLKKYHTLSCPENFISNIEFDYFHVERDICNEIRSSTDIIKEDPIFERDIKLFPDRVFCSTSQFFKGCIRIILKNRNVPIIG